MNLAAIFGDDEHTAADGAYTRMLRARKWLYLTSFIALIVAHQMLVLPRLNELLKIVALQDWFVRQGVLLGLAYLVTQYLLLVVQVCMTYGVTLEERLNDRRAKRLESVAESLFSARATLAKHRAEEEIGPPGDLHRAAARARVVGAERQVDRLEAEHARLTRNPQASPVFVLSEGLIDLLRSAPPAVAGIYAFWALISWS